MPIVAVDDVRAQFDDFQRRKHAAVKKRKMFIATVRIVDRMFKDCIFKSFRGNAVDRNVALKGAYPKVKREFMGAMLDAAFGYYRNEAVRSAVNDAVERNKNCHLMAEGGERFGKRARHVSKPSRFYEGVDF